MIELAGLLLPLRFSGFLGMFCTTHSEATINRFDASFHLPPHYRDSEATLQAAAISVCAFECVHIIKKDLFVALIYCFLSYFFETGAFTEPQACGFS
jgi:hypothetical protein